MPETDVVDRVGMAEAQCRRQAARVAALHARHQDARLAEAMLQVFRDSWSVLRDVQAGRDRGAGGGPALHGYARAMARMPVEVQLARLEQAGCGRIVVEPRAGRWSRRAAMRRLLADMRPGDVVVVAALSALAVSAIDLVHAIASIDAAGIGLRSLGEDIDTTGSAGWGIGRALAVLVEFDRMAMRDLTRAGLAGAALRGKSGGRRPKLNEDQRAELVALVTSGRTTGSEAARLFKIDPATVSRIVGAARHQTVPSREADALR